MSDLISRSEAIQRLIQETIDSKNNLIHINTVKRLLQDVDTAYDVDKVVEELEEVHKKFCNSVTCGGKSMCKDCEEYIMLKKNIEIVKAVGVNGQN